MAKISKSNPTISQEAILDNFFAEQTGLKVQNEHDQDLFLGALMPAWDEIILGEQNRGGCEGRPVSINIVYSSIAIQVRIERHLTNFLPFFPPLAPVGLG